MASETDSPLSDVGRPGRSFWTALAFVLSLLVGYAVLIEGALLLGVIVGSFVVLCALTVWFLSRLVGLAGVPIRSEPVTVAAVLSVLVLPYSLVIEGAVLLGVIACVLLLAAGIGVGLALGERSPRERSPPERETAVEERLQGPEDDNRAARHDEREPERER
jgi:hypothetical protein